MLFGLNKAISLSLGLPIMIKEDLIVARAYYSSDIKHFLDADSWSIFGEIVSRDQFAADDLQKNTWRSEIEILKSELAAFQTGHLLFEYTIPRIGNRIDNVFIHNGIIFLLEFKVGESIYRKDDINQVTDYALDISCFHKESHDKLLVPILICTRAPEKTQTIKIMKDKILETHCCNEFNIGKYIHEVCAQYHPPRFEAETWVNSIYMPTPTIIEAAQALYIGHNVKDISRNDARAKNLNQTTLAINKIIEHSKINNQKAICFITGVPGQGKP